MRIKALKECYQRLELPNQANAAEIRQAYKRLVKKWHPDKFESDSPIKAYAEERIKLINAAYDLLRKHQSETKPLPKSKSETPRPSEKSTSCHGCPQNGAFFKRRSFHHLTALIGFVKEILHSSGSNQTRINQIKKAGHEKLSKTFQQNLGGTRVGDLKTGHDRKKGPDGFNTIHALRRHYGPRPKKGAGPISEVAPLEKNQRINAVHRITPIGPVE
jgi:curved DNA-binding protein CbpA